MQGSEDGGLKLKSLKEKVSFIMDQVAAVIENCGSALISAQKSVTEEFKTPDPPKSATKLAISGRDGVSSVATTVLGARGIAEIAPIVSSDIINL